MSAQRAEAAIWIYKRTRQFKKSFDALSVAQQKQAKDCYNKVFKKNPFDPSLKSHKIHKLSSRHRCIVYAAHIENEKNFIFTFRQDGNAVTALDIGTHAIYK